jgi:hypothetical protein
MTLSACIIAKNEVESLQKAINSIRHLVDEVVLVRTTDMPCVVEGVDKFEVFTNCNAQTDCVGECGCKVGDILDFAHARNYCFSLASNNAIVWLDSDDVVVGGTTLKSYVREKPLLFPYQYDARSRMFIPRILFQDGTKWTYPIHETISSISAGEMNSDFTWVHERTSTGVQNSAKRNLRIHLHWEKNPQLAHDPRFLYFKGRAWIDIGKPLKALAPLHEAFVREAWPERRFVIAQDIACALPYERALEWAFKAMELKPEWPHSWLMLAKLYHALGNPIYHKFLEVGQSLPVPVTISQLIPLTRFTLPDVS